MQSLEQNTALFNNSSIGIVMVDITGNILKINPAAFNEFGYNEDELIYKSISVLIPERFKQNHEKYHEQYFKHPVTRPMGVGRELFARRKDGTEFPVEISLSHYEVNGENFVMAFIINISVRKKAEAEILRLNNHLEITVERRTKDLRKALEHLKASSGKLEDALAYQKALLDNAGAMIIATDESGVITLFNPEASRNLGYDEAEIIKLKTPLIFHDKNELEKKRKYLERTHSVRIED